MKICLNGEWQFASCLNGEWLPAVVPGCNYTDLLNLGKLEDPFYGTNEKSAVKIGEKDWIYRRNFKLENKEKFDRIYLCAERLDTLCIIKLNGREIGRSENCHLPFRTEIKEFLSDGDNFLELNFLSPIKFVKERLKSRGAPRNNNGMNGVVHIRKPQYHFGWDWGPCLPPSGISGDIYLDCKTDAEISNFKLVQNHENSIVTVAACAEIISYNGRSVSWTAVLIAPDGKTEKITGVSDKEIKAEFIVKNPRIWWTRELSGKENQPLYRVKLSLDGIENESTEKQIGLRTIELDRGFDEYGQNFCFKLNGVPLFIKGANLIPPDSFINRASKAEWDKIFAAAQFSNFNLIRVWGGGYYASEEFLDECDRRGLLVWQDFMFACQAYPFFEKEFLDNVKREVEFQTARLSHRACLVVWCGNNEIETMDINWFWKKEYLKWTEKFFYNILPEWVKAIDSKTPFIPTSPCGTGYKEGNGSDNVGDTHLWAVWHGLQPLDYYRKRYTRFCSEFGFESLPEEKTLLSFAEKEDFALKSEVFLAHQKSRGGNGKMQYYIASRFRLPLNFVDYSYLSQLCQAECVRDATEHWRRNKGRCNGSVYWQLNDCWQVCSWSGMDYFYRYKALQYAAKRFFSPICLSAENRKNNLLLHLINDTLTSFNAEVIVKLRRFSGETVSEERISVFAEAGQAKSIYELKNPVSRKDRKNTFAQVELYMDGKLTQSVKILFAKERDIAFPDPKISVDCEVSNGIAKLTLTALKFARAVRLECGEEPFSDNWFDISPGETVTVTQKTDSATTSEYLKNLRVFSLSDVEPAKGRLHDAISQLKVILNPVNFFSKIFTAKVPHDVDCSNKGDKK